MVLTFCNSISGIHATYSRLFRCALLFLPCGQHELLKLYVKNVLSYVLSLIKSTIIKNAISNSSISFHIKLCTSNVSGLWPKQELTPHCSGWSPSPYMYNWLTLLQCKCLPSKQLNKTLNTGFTYYFVILHFTNAWRDLENSQFMD